MGMACSVAAAQNCAPPDDFKDKLQGQPSAEVLSDLGVWFGNHDQYDCAAQAFATSLQTDPNQRDLPHVVFLFGASLYYLGDFKEAIPSLQEAEKLGYRHITVNITLAQALDKTQQYAASVEEWKKVLEFEPESTEAVDAVSNDLLTLNKYSDVLNFLERPRLAPNRTEHQFVTLAAAYEKLGKKQEVLSTLQQGLNTYPSSMQIAQQLSSLLKDSGRDQEAAMVLKLAESQQASSTAATKQ